MGSRPPSSDQYLFLEHVWLWEVLGHFCVQPLSWSLPVVIYNPLSLHIMIQLKNGSLLHRIREDDTSE